MSTFTHMMVEIVRAGHPIATTTGSHRVKAGEPVIAGDVFYAVETDYEPLVDEMAGRGILLTRWVQ